MALSKDDSYFLNKLRGASILRVVLGHLGLFWILPPYSGFFHSLLPVLFFVSGAVTFYSYKRSQGDVGFIIKRLISLLIPYYVVCFFCFIFIVLQKGELPPFDINILLNWVMINPPSTTTPYNLGQVWYIHALTIIILISPIIFRLINKNPWLYLVPIGLSLCISSIQLFYPINKSLVVSGHNLYQPLVNLMFFCLGSAFFSHDFFSKRSFYAGKLLVFLMVSIALVIALSLKVDLKYHSYSPDLYYISCSLVALSLIMYFRAQIISFCQNLKLIEKVLDFFNKHAYSIYLTHSLFIDVSENVFGLIDVINSPIHAVIKILFVLLSSALLAIPLSYINKFVIGHALKLVKVKSSADFNKPDRTSKLLP